MPINVLAPFQLLLLLPTTILPSIQAEILWKDVCNNEENWFPYCNTNLTRSQRIDDYVQRIPVKQKIQMMVHQARGYDQLSVPPYQWWSEGLHGALQPCVCQENTCKCPTSFPCPSGLGNAFNKTLWRAIGSVVGREARAISNLRKRNDGYGIGITDYDGLTYWSPTINPQRDPRWGRNQESPSEDPYVVSDYAKAFVQGLQQGRATSGKKNVQILQVGACCKHFIANSLEGGTDESVSRHNFNARISEFDLQHYYEIPFQACVDAGSIGVMCSYNALNGIPMCANQPFLKDLLRKDWKFDGYVTSDCGALDDVVNGHHFVNTSAEAAAVALKAGTDLNCGSLYSDNLQSALEASLIEESDIDTSFRRLVNVQMQLGLFDPKDHLYNSLGIEDIDQSRELALEAARQAIVLLKNDNEVLPFQVPVQTLAVLGPHLNASKTFMSNYHGDRCVDRSFDCVVTPLEAISAANVGGNTIERKGCENVTSGSYEALERAKEVAEEANAIVLLLGLDQTLEAEGQDRLRTTLPTCQQLLLDLILDLGNPNTVVVLLHGGTVSLGKAVLDRVPALLSASYGGQEGATAIADILFGNYNPTGRLVSTVYPPGYVKEIPISEMGLSVGPGRTHMFYKGTPEFAFGSGLSYCQLQLKWSETTFTEEAFHLRIHITNIRGLPGAQTVLLFLRPVNDYGTGLKQKLLDYQSIGILEVGQTAEISFHLDGFLPCDDPQLARRGFNLVASAAATEISLFVPECQSESRTSNFCGLHSLGYLIVVTILVMAVVLSQRIFFGGSYESVPTETLSSQ